MAKGGLGRPFYIYPATDSRQLGSNQQENNVSFIRRIHTPSCEIKRIKFLSLTTVVKRGKLPLLQSPQTR
jgi:hypothetical protein